MTIYIGYETNKHDRCKMQLFVGMQGYMKKINVQLPNFMIKGLTFNGYSYKKTDEADRSGFWCTDSLYVQ